MKKIRKIELLAAMIMMMSVFMVSITEAAPKGFQFYYKGVSIGMNDRAADFIKKAGKAKSKSESKSCAFAGMDRTYNYTDFTLSTYSKSVKGQEYVNGITIKTSQVKTKEGLKIGNSKNDIIRLYGKAKNVFDVYTYSKGGTKLLIGIDRNDKVESIQYMTKE